MWSWRTEDVAGYQKIFDEFEKETGISAEFKPYKNTEYDTILETALEGGKGPDVMQLRAYGSLQPLVDAGHIEPLDSRVKALDGFSEQSLDGARSIKDGKVYGVPFAIQTLQVFYNEKIFEKNGIEEPQTYDEFIAAAKKLKGAGVTPIAVGGRTRGRSRSCTPSWGPNSTAAMRSWTLHLRTRAPSPRPSSWTRWLRSRS